MSLPGRSVLRVNAKCDDSIRSFQLLARDLQARHSKGGLIDQFPQLVGIIQRGCANDNHIRPLDWLVKKREWLSFCSTEFLSERTKGLTDKRLLPRQPGYHY